MSEAVRSFKLSPAFLEDYEGKQPEWGPVGYITYKRTYARSKEDGSTEEFWETCKRVVEGCYYTQKKRCYDIGLAWDNVKAQRSAQEMFRRMWAFKWLPPGRGLWMMGTEYIERTGSAALNNCFGGNTRVITSRGLVPIKELAGTSPTLLTEGGKWVEAPVRSFGRQQLYKLTLRRQGVEKDVFTTKGHLWYARDRRQVSRNAGFIPIPTDELRPEVHHLQYVFGRNALKKSALSPIGVSHGFVFGDGHSPQTVRQTAKITLCADKDKALLDWISPRHVVNSIGEYPVVSGFPNYFKSLPSIEENHSYLAGWLAGYFAADGTVKRSGQVVLSSSIRANLEFAKSVCAVLGVGVYSIREETRVSNLTHREHTMYSLGFIRDTLIEDFFLLESHKTNFVENPTKKSPKAWTVVSVTPTERVEEVYCATVDNYHKFALEDNILCGNCGFVSTAGIAVDFADPFCWLMDMLMLGVGVGFDVKGAGLVKVQEPRRTDDVFVVEDSRKGWIDLVRLILTAYAGRGGLPRDIDFSGVRPAGEPIKGFGGTASGPGPLNELVVSIQEVLNPLVGESITGTAIVDICNLVGRCVVAGNVRRSAEIAFGSPNDDTFLDLKNPDVWGEEVIFHHRWASNNSIFAEVGMDYTEVAKRTAINGEPGYEWLDNARAYGRMGRPATWKDRRVAGANPCQPGWATVLTPHGIRTISDIGVGSVIWSGRRWTTVTAKWSTGVKPVARYQTTAGVFVGTANHRVVEAGEKCEVKDVQGIDRCAGPQPQSSEILDPAHIIEGLVTGDGTNYGGSGRGGVVLIVGHDDIDYHSSEVSSLLHKCVDVDKGLWTTASRQEHLVPLPERALPEHLVRGDARTVRGVLRGLFSANGSVVTGRKSGRVTLKTTSGALRDQVQIMLSGIGICSYFTINKSHDVQFSNGTYTCKESYDINITSDRFLFRDLVGFIQSGKTDRLHIICGAPSKYAHSRPKLTFDVQSVEQCGVEEVFDLTVDDEDHTYWTGGLLVSNCVEQSLEDRELCCLVETFPGQHDTYDDYQQTLKYAYLYAKSVTLLHTHDRRTNQVLLRNRRIGASMSGISQAIKKHGRREFFNWCDAGYTYLRDLDKMYSDWLCVRESIKITSVKPSGTVSLLPGVTPGIHFPHSEYYIRRIRFNKDHPLVGVLRAHNYFVEDDKYSPNTVVASFPIHEEMFDRAKDEVSMWEQLELAAQMQQYWADNQVSVTVTFQPHEAKDIKYALELYEVRLKGVSFLPLGDHGYAQAPYETITKVEYEVLTDTVTPIQADNGSSIEHDTTEMFCDGDACIVQF